MLEIEKELAEIPSEGDGIDDLFPTEEEQENKTSEESPAEKKEEEKENEEENLPFHKHPRFKELVAEKNAFKAELEKVREEFNSRFDSVIEDNQENKYIPDWFVELYGENESAWNKYQDYDKSTRDEIKREIMSEMGADLEAVREIKYQKEFNEWSDRKMDELSENNEFDRNELMKFMVDYPIYNDQNQLDFGKGLELLNLSKRKDPEKLNARKSIVDEGKNSKAEQQTKKWFTPEDTRAMPWTGMI